MEAKEDRWLAERFGRPVLRLDGRGVPPALPADAFCYAKVDTKDVETVKALSAAGFYVVDVNVTFGVASAKAKVAPPAAGIEVKQVSGPAAAACVDIAGRCFQYSRFHLDPAVPRALADRIKRDWIENYALGKRGLGLFEASVGGKPAGFLAVIGSERRRVIDLVGVDPSMQRRGAGRELVAFFLRRYAPECDELLVGTQAANLPSMALYLAAGFGIVSTSYVLHRP